MSDLASRECVPCRGGVPPLPVEAQQALLAQLTPEWQIVNGHHLERAYRFRNFAAALAFVNRVGELAEQQNHHPQGGIAIEEVHVERIRPLGFAPGHAERRRQERVPVVRFTIWPSPEAKQGKNGPGASGRCGRKQADGLSRGGLSGPAPP